MGINKFIKSVIGALNLKDFELKSKKKSLKTLLCKLKKHRVKILKELKKEKSKKEILELNEELELISVHIKNGKERLNALKKPAKK